MHVRPTALRSLREQASGDACCPPLVVQETAGSRVWLSGQVF